MTNVKQENLDNLVKVGNNLLQQKVKRINVNTFEPYVVVGDAYGEKRH